MAIGRAAANLAVNVKVNTKTAAAQMEAFDRRMAASATSAENVSRSYDKVGASSKTMGKDVQDTDVHVRKSSDGFRGFSKNIITTSASIHVLSKAIGLLKWPAFIAAAGVAADAIGVLLGGAVALTGALGPLTGSLASAGSALLLFGQVRAVVALTGIKDVTSAVGGLNEKLDESVDAFKKLSPEAQEFARSLQDAKKPVRELQAAIQKPMFKALNSGLDNVMSQMPIFQKVLTGTARRIGTVIERMSEFVGSKGFGRDFEKVGRTNNRVLGKLGGVVVHLAKAFMDVVVVARPLTKFFGNLFARWGKGIEVAAELNRKNGDMADFFAKTKDVTQDMVALFKNLWSALYNITRLGAPLGRQIVDRLVAGSRALKAWTESASGRNAIAEFFKDIRPPLWEAGRLIVDLTKAFFALQSGSGGVLTKMLRQLRVQLLPVLVDLIRSTTEAFGPRLIDLLTNVAKLVGSLAGSSGPLNLFVDTLNEMAKALNWMIENIPGFQTIVITLGSLIAIGKAFSFAGAITGVKTFIGWIEKATAALVGMKAAETAAATTNVVGGGASGLSSLGTSIAASMGSTSSKAVEATGASLGSRLIGGFTGVVTKFGPWAAAAGGIANILGDMAGGDQKGAAIETGGALAGALVGGVVGGVPGAMIGSGIGTVVADALGDVLASQSTSEKIAQRAADASKAWRLMPRQLKTSSQQLDRAREQDREATNDLREAEQKLMRVRDKYPDNSRQVVKAERDVENAKHRSQLASYRVGRAEHEHKIIRDQSRESAERAVRSEAAHIQVLKDERQEAFKTFVELKRNSDVPREVVDLAFQGYQAKSQELRDAVKGLDTTISQAREAIGPKFAKSLETSAVSMGRFERKLAEMGGTTDAFAGYLEALGKQGRALPKNLVEKAGLDPKKLKAAGVQIVNIRQGLEQFGKTGAGKLFQMTDRMKSEFGSVAVAVANMGKKQRQAYKDAAKQALDSGAITRNEYDRLMDKFRKAAEVQRDSWKKASRATGESVNEIKQNVHGMTVKVSKDYENMVTVSGGGIDWLMSKTGKAMKALGLKQELKFTRERGGLPPSQAGHPRRRGGEVQASLVPGIGTGDKVPLHMAGVHVANVEPGELVSVTNRRATERLMQANDAYPRDGGPIGTFRKGGEVAMGGMSAMLALANKYERAAYPYQWGGGHGGFPNGTQPVDCSGAVSDILHAGGLLQGAPMVSGALMSWGQPASGNEAVVVYANPEHTVMSLNGRVFGTSGSNPNEGAGWIEGASGASLAPGAKRTMPVKGGAATQIPRQILKGGEGTRLHEIGQESMDKTWRGANALLARLMPTGTFGGGDAALPGIGTYTASWYGPTPATVGAAGVDLRGTQSFAELSNDPGNGTGADFAALGGLPFHTHISVTYKGKTIDVEKLDVGAGGPGLNGHIRAIDLWEDAAKRLPGFMAAGIADVDIGMGGSGGGRKGARRGHRAGGIIDGLRIGGLVGPQLDKLTMGRPAGGGGGGRRQWSRDSQVSKWEARRLAYIAGHAILSDKGPDYPRIPQRFRNAANKATTWYRDMSRKDRWKFFRDMRHRYSDHHGGQDGPYNVRTGGVLGLQDGGAMLLSAAAGGAQPTGSATPDPTGGVFHGQGTAVPSGDGRGGGGSNKILNLSKTIKRLVGLDDTKKFTAAEQQKKIIEGVKNKLKKLTRGKNFPLDANGEFQGKLGELREQADKYGEYADIASRLGEPYKKKDEAGWLQQQLMTLLRLRNAVIAAMREMEEKAKDVKHLKHDATGRLRDYEKKIKRGEKDLDRDGKLPKDWDKKDLDPTKVEVKRWNALETKKRKALAAKFDRHDGRLPGDRAFTDDGKLISAQTDPGKFPNIEGWKRVETLLKNTVLGAITGSDGIEGIFKQTTDTLAEELKTVAGSGSGRQHLKAKDVFDKLGRFGGEIFDIQIALRDLAEANAPKALTIEDLRSVIEAARYGVFDDLPKFHTGGVVPGPANVEVPIMARGGEVVSAGPGDVKVVNNFSWDEFGAVVETEVNDQFVKRERIERHRRRQF
jgi:hypothetical protein